jgi:hypothetical protein
MRTTIIFASIAALPLFLLGCGADSQTGTDPQAPADSEAEGESVGSTTEAWTASLPAGSSGATPAASVIVSGCRFTVGHALQSGSLPPKTIAYVQKTALVPGSCPSKLGYTVIGSTYGATSLSIAKHPTWPFIIASYTYRSTPSGEAHTHLGIAQVSFGIGAVMRTTGLSAMAPSASEPWKGNVTSGALSINAAGDLTSTGTFDGVIPGSTGAGSHYTATWRDFIWDWTPGPAPTSVVLTP